MDFSLASSSPSSSLSVSHNSVPCPKITFFFFFVFFLISVRRPSSGLGESNVFLKCSFCKINLKTWLLNKKDQRGTKNTFWLHYAPWTGGRGYGLVVSMLMGLMGREIVLSSWRRQFTLIVLLSTQVYNRVPANCWRQPCDGLASQPEDAQCYRNRDTLRHHGHLVGTLILTSWTERWVWAT